MDHGGSEMVVIAPTQMKVRLPRDAKAFIKAEASRNGSSQNSEIVRCIRERMDRSQTVATNGEPPITTPPNL